MVSDIFLAAFLREPSFYTDYGTVVDQYMFDDSASKVCIGAYVDYTSRYNQIPKEEEMYASLEQYCSKYRIDDVIKQRDRKSVV